MMKVLRSLAEATGLRAPVATIGNFDGLHRGHRAIIDRVVSRARPRQGTALLITFEPHPLPLLPPDRAPSMLVTAARGLLCLHILVIGVATSAEDPRKVPDPTPPPLILTPAALTLRHAPLADCARYDNLRSNN